VIAVAMMKGLSSCLLLTLALMLCAQATALAQQKAALSVKSRLVDATVEIDDKLKPYPGLSASLLADSKRWVERMQAEADKERREDIVLFREAQRWILERTYELRATTGRYVSVLRNDEIDTGGNNAVTVTDAIVWDQQAKKRVGIRPFFRETADNGPTMKALARLIRIAVAAEKIARDLPDPLEPEKPSAGLTAETFAERDQLIAEGVQPKLAGLGPATLAPSTVAGKSSGLTFHFAPYAVGSYTEGSYTVFVAWTEFKSYLSAEGAAIFAGERPETDKGS
jgi:hypothetical protein